MDPAVQRQRPPKLKNRDRQAVQNIACGSLDLEHTWQLASKAVKEGKIKSGGGLCKCMCVSEVYVCVPEFAGTVRPESVEKPPASRHQ